jgi:hypothetical protein
MVGGKNNNGGMRRRAKRRNTRCAQSKATRKREGHNSHPRLPPTPESKHRVSLDDMCAKRTPGRRSSTRERQPAPVLLPLPPLVIMMLTICQKARQRNHRLQHRSPRTTRSLNTASGPGTRRTTLSQSSRAKPMAVSRISANFSPSVRRVHAPHVGHLHSFHLADRRSHRAAG